VVALYPVWEITRFSEPRRYFDRRVIAWGGVVAQAIVAVTPRIWADLGFVSLSVAVFHPLPIRPLDGAIAWGLSPHSSNACTPNQPDGNPDGHLGDKFAGCIPIV
jgi:hypothetical protein